MNSLKEIQKFLHESNCYFSSLSVAEKKETLLWYGVFGVVEGDQLRLGLVGFALLEAFLHLFKLTIML